jgi:toxin ParE1/3/4
MVKVIWSKQAIENIHAIREHYFPISPKYAEKLTEEIFNKEEILINFPLAGRIVNYSHPSILQTPFKLFFI